MFRKSKITVKEPYYIPAMEEMLELVGKGCVLSKVDLAKGFHQVEVAEEDRDKTCFVCPSSPSHPPPQKKLLLQNIPTDLVNIIAVQ